MKTSIFAVRRLTLSDMSCSNEFASYQSESIQGYGRTLDRYTRCQKAAEYGADGSTHAEVIQDFRDYLNHLRLNREIPSRVYDSIESEIDACEAYHEQAGTLEQQIN